MVAVFGADRCPSLRKERRDGERVAFLLKISCEANLELFCRRKGIVLAESRPWLRRQLGRPQILAYTQPTPTTSSALQHNTVSHSANLPHLACIGRIYYEKVTRASFSLVRFPFYFCAFLALCQVWQRCETPHLTRHTTRPAPCLLMEFAPGYHGEVG